MALFRAVKPLNQPRVTGHVGVPEVFMSKVSLLGEFVLFLRENKKLWLLPIVITLLLLGALLVFAQGSALAPFIYTVF
jgi:hypothetical protein